MKVLAHVHRFPPGFRAGAEWYLFELLSFLRSRGHQVRVLVRDVESGYTFRDVHVLYGKDRDNIATGWEWCDVGLTHLDLTRGAVTQARRYGKPVVHLVHNERQLNFWRVYPRDAALVVYNSEWVRAATEQRERRFRSVSLVARPLVRVADYAQWMTGDALTLVNLSENKGALLVWELARRLPGQEFIGVVGAYHEQLPPPTELGNVTVMANGEIGPVYARTRILLMPSLYESWGRTALEAGASGIPTIAHPAPGLLESLGGAGVFAARDDPDAWVEWVERLSRRGVYEALSLAALRRARLQESRALAELDKLAGRLEQL